MSIHLDPLSIGYVTLRWTASYFVTEALLRHPEADHSFGEKENFPVRFSLLTLPSDRDAAVFAGASTAFPMNHIAFVNSAFFTLSKESQRFILLHECGHMKNGDVHVMAIADIVSVIAASIFFPAHPFLATLGICLIFQGFLSTVQERRADSFAITHSSIEELKGGTAFFEQRRENKIQRWTSSTSFSSKIHFIAQALTYYVFQGHPLESSRITKIQKELQKRESLSHHLCIC